MQKGTHVIYGDSTGKEHDALVRALNGLNPGYITVVYVDRDAPDGDNLKTVYDIPHVSDESRKEMRTVKGVDVTGAAIDVKQGNPSLPDIHLNFWKEVGESHTAPASDHPMFDHPFKEKEHDEFGKVIEPARPEHDAMVAAHVASLPSAADLDAAADDEKAKEATNGKKNGKPKPVAIGK